MDESLTSFIEEVCGDSHLRVESDLGDGFVRLRSSEAERRQAQHDIRCTEDIVIEMLRNARDASAKNIFIALSRDDKLRFICLIDDGEGIPAHLHDQVFESRVTSKLDSLHIDKWGVHGRGMALFSIASNANKAFVVSSDRGKGTSLFVETDLTAVPEKTDQSSMPTFSYDDAGELVLRGPHNINRTIVEFALESEGICEVYYGSPAEIAATLYEFGTATVTKSIRTFCTDENELSVAKRLCLAADPSSLASLSEGIGLKLSERTARRILDHEIKALSSVLEIIESQRKGLQDHDRSRKTAKKNILLKDARGLKISPDDLDEFSQSILKAYKDLAKRYYLEESVSPEIRLSQEGLHIRIPISKLY